MSDPRHDTLPLADVRVLRLQRRMRHLPAAIENTERKLIGLYLEAQAHRLEDALLESQLYGAVIEAGFSRAKMEARLNGRPASLGDVE